MVTNFHSPATASSPLCENCRNPKTRFTIPNTGSTVHFLRPYAARPAPVLSWCATNGALHTNLPAHKFYQSLADRKPQTRATKTTGDAAIGLGKRGKESRLRLR